MKYIHTYLFFYFAFQEKKDSQENTIADDPSFILKVEDYTDLCLKEKVPKDQKQAMTDITNRRYEMGPTYLV